MQTIKTYYRLTKPGIIYGNIITTVAGFLLAAQGKVNFELFVATFFGVAIVIGSACVFNNYLDREIDKKMARTQKRALVTHAISPRNALIFATLLGVIGFIDLLFFVNFLTFLLGLIGFIDYVIFYGWSKRNSIYGTLVGSISGAVPIAAGYTAVTNRFDTAALLLFLIMVFWQMPHFYAIAIYRLKDYAAAKIPVLPVKKSMFRTKLETLFYLLAFVISSLLLTVFHITGTVYLIIMSILGAGWLLFAVSGFTIKHVDAWARKMFFFSLIAVLVLCIILSVDSFLPIPWK